MKKLFFLSVYCINFFNIRAQEPKLVLPIGHVDEVVSAQYSPNGKYIVTTSKDNTAKLWDVNSGKLINTLSGHTSWINSGMFSPNGKLIVTASCDNTAKLWDANSGKLINTLSSHISWVNFAKFSPDGNFIVTASSDSTAKIWNSVSGKIVHTFTGHHNKVYDVQFSPNGNFIATASLDSTAKIWNPVSGKLIFTLTGHLNNVTHVQFSPDSKTISTASLDNTAKIWDVNSGKLLFTLANHTWFVNSAKYSPSGKLIVTSSRDGTTILWDSKSGKLLHKLAGHSTYVNYAEFSFNEKIIATASSDNTVKIWDVKSGALLRTLVGHTNEIYHVSFSPDNRFLVSSARDNSSIIWNANSGKIQHRLVGHTNYIISTQFSSNGKNVVASTTNSNGTFIWDIDLGKLKYNIPGETDIYNYPKFSADGKLVASPSNDYSAKVWDVTSGNLNYDLGDISKYGNFSKFSQTGKYFALGQNQYVNIWDATSGELIKTLENKNGHVHHFEFSPDDKFIITTSSNGTSNVWETFTGKLVNSLNSKSEKNYSTKFRTDGKLFVTLSESGVSQIWNPVSGELIQSTKVHSQYITSAQFSPDNASVLTASRDSTAKIWDAATGKIMSTLKGHSSQVSYAQFIQNGKFVITSSNDYSVKKWNSEDGKQIQSIYLGLNTQAKDFHFQTDKILASNNSELKVFSLSNGKLLYSFLAVDSSDYIFYLPQGFYLASTNASKLLHYVTKDIKVITFEQLDVKYNRPDKVLQALGNTDTTLINSYRKAYQKRIKKLGIDTTQFADGYSVPEADFVNRDNIEYEQNKQKISLSIKANDSTYKLDRFNVWVNDVPVFGLRGLRVKRKNNFDTTITITLSQGENRIEISVINVNGTESYKMPLFVKYTAAKPQPSKQHFIGIGINQFSNADYNLNWSVKDIRDLAIKFKSKYPNIIIDTLFDKNVTKENILALKRKLLQLKEDDKVIVSYSGHGVLSKDFDYFLSTYSIDFTKPEENGLAYDDLESLLDNIKPRQKLLLIDACHSGEVDKDELLKIETAKTELDKNGVVAKSSIKITAKEKKLGMANSFELMQNLFVNVGKGTGATIISAAGGTQYAQERGDLKNGVFTYSLIEAFNQNSTLKVSELKKKVGERVTQLTNGLQKPTSRNETNSYDWVIW